MYLRMMVMGWCSSLPAPLLFQSWSASHASHLPSGAGKFWDIDNFVKGKIHREIPSQFTN